MQEAGDDYVPDVLSTPVFGEQLTVLNVTAPDCWPTVAEAVAATQSRAGWHSSVIDRTALTTSTLHCVDTVVLWGARAGDCRKVIEAPVPTVLVLEESDARKVLVRPLRWLAEVRTASRTNLILLPAGVAERFTRWGPPIPLAALPDGLRSIPPQRQAVTRFSAWVARAYAFGRRTGIGAE